MADEKKPPSDGTPPAGEPEQEAGWKSQLEGSAETREKKWAPKGKWKDREKAWGNRKERKQKTEPAVSKVGIGPLFVFSNKKERAEKSFVQGLQRELSVEVLSGALDMQSKKASLTLVNAKAEGSVVHGEFDIADWVKELIFGKKKDDQPKLSIPAPMAARVGDPTAHGSLLNGLTASPDVFIEGKPAWRAMRDIHLCTTDAGAGVATTGALTVFINGAPAARAGDLVTEPLPNMIVSGCSKVFIGQAACPPAIPRNGAVSDPSKPWVIFESVAKGDFLTGEAHLSAEAEIDLKKGRGKVEAQVGGMIALLKGEIPFKTRVRIPFTSLYVGLGATLEGTLGSAGAEAGAGVKWNDPKSKKLFEATAGAKAGAGIGGLGLSFSLDISRE